MAGRYVREIRFRFNGDKDRAMQKIPDARKYMGELLEDAAYHDLQYHTRMITEADGTIIEVLTNNGLQIATITVPPLVVENPEPEAPGPNKVPYIQAYMFDLRLLQTESFCEDVVNQWKPPHYMNYYVHLFPREDTTLFLAKVMTALARKGYVSLYIWVEAESRAGGKVIEQWRYLAFHETESVNSYAMWPDTSLNGKAVDDESITGLPAGYFTGPKNVGMVERAWEMEYLPYAYYLGVYGAGPEDLWPGGYNGAYAVPSVAKLVKISASPDGLTEKVWDLRKQADYDAINALI